MSVEDSVHRGILDRGGYIHGVNPVGVEDAKRMAHALVELVHEYGAVICKRRGDHDYSDKVPHTSNMFLCFRCGEPGWQVPDAGT